MTQMNHNELNISLAHEEEELLHSIEQEEWQSITDVDNAILEHTQAAKRTLAKDQRINIRLSAHDLELLRTSAVELGLPYQTLASSVLHQYATGRLVTKT